MKLPLSMLLFAIMFFITILAESMPAIYIGGFIGGIALSLFFPQIILLTGLSVEPVMIPVAVSLLTCSQNLGHILCPYAVNPLAELLSFLILGMILLIYSLRRNRKKRAV